jgi:hypothetical protein
MLLLKSQGQIEFLRLKTAGAKRALIPSVVVEVRKQAHGAQEVVGIAFLQRLELPSHSPVLFDCRLEPSFELRNTLLIVGCRILPWISQLYYSASSTVQR